MNSPTAHRPRRMGPPRALVRTLRRALPRSVQRLLAAALIVVGLAGAVAARAGTPSATSSGMAVLLAGSAPIRLYVTPTQVHVARVHPGRMRMAALRDGRGRDPDDHVIVGGDSDLPAGQHAHSVVSVFGSASSEGDATGDVVSVFGNTRVTGTGTHDAVSVLGSTYIDSHIDGDAVAVLGTVRLGPHADVEGDVTAVGGTVELAAGANVHGQVQQVAADLGSAGSAGLRWFAPWGRHALLYFRPLGWGPGLGWAWAVAAAFLGLYVFLALLVPAGISACERTLRQHPGGTLLAAVLTTVATPFAILILAISVVGAPAIPALLLALLCAGLFGKAVMLAWLGRNCLGGARTGGAGSTVHPALVVLLGGLIVAALYLVPVLGFVVYNVLGVLGLGTVVYTLVLAAQARRAGAVGANAAGGPVGTGGPAAGASGAAAGPAPTAAAAASTAAGASASNASAASARADVVPPPVPVATLPRAGFWVRIAALLLDAILIGIVVHELPHSHNLELLALAIYGAVMWKLRGSTIGGIIFDLQVVRLDGREVDWTTAIVRALGCFLSLVIVGLGFIWIAIDDGKQAWHDKFAGTVVVRVAHATAPL